MNVLVISSTEDVKRPQKEARKEILENKKNFRHKVEDSFASNNSRAAVEQSADNDRLQPEQEVAGC